jgi:hypothetical protein
MPVILATQEAEIRRIAVQRQPWANSSRDPISKIPNTKQCWRMGQVVEHLPSKREALSSNFTTEDKKKKVSLGEKRERKGKKTQFREVLSWFYYFNNY